jgi:polysaccharide pyruvyl transferase WcaK-like protein
MRYAKTLGKYVAYVNAGASDCPKSGRNEEIYSQATEIMGKIDFVAARDRTSLAYFREMGITENVRYLPDALFTWPSFQRKRFFEYDLPVDYFVPFPEYPETTRSLNLPSEYICLGGSSSAAWFQNPATPAYKHLALQLREIDLPILLIESCTGDSFMRSIAVDTSLPLIPVQTNIQVASDILANARVFVSGRYHPSILASLGGTPCVFLSSNSHKTLSLQQTLQYDAPWEASSIPSEEDSDAIVRTVERRLSSGERERDRILTIAGQLSKDARRLLHFLP